MSLNGLTATWAPRLLSLMRLMAGLLFMQHGTQKLLGIPTFPARFSRRWAVSPAKTIVRLGRATLRPRAPGV